MGTTSKDLGDSAGLGLLVDRVGVLRRNCTLYRVIHGYDRSLGLATKRLQIIAMWLIEFTPEYVVQMDFSIFSLELDLNYIFYNYFGQPLHFSQYHVLLIIPLIKIVGSETGRIRH